MKDYYVLIYPWAVYVKEAHFFEAQGGTTAEWGKRWERIKAKNLTDAHKKAAKISRERSILGGAIYK